MNPRLLAKLVPAAFVVFLLTGCATQKIDWSARLGHYTYDQAVAEFGPANKTNRLADGSVTADWLLERGHVQPAPQLNTTAPGAIAGPPMPVYQPYIPDYYMRLTFGSDAQLKGHKEFVR